MNRMEVNTLRYQRRYEPVESFIDYNRSLDAIVTASTDTCGRNVLDELEANEDLNPHRHLAFATSTIGYWNSIVHC